MNEGDRETQRRVSPLARKLTRRGVTSGTFILIGQSPQGYHTAGLAPKESRFYTPPAFRSLIRVPFRPKCLSSSTPYRLSTLYPVLGTQPLRSSWCCAYWRRWAACDDGSSSTAILLVHLFMSIMSRSGRHLARLTLLTTARGKFAS